MSIYTGRNAVIKMFDDFIKKGFCNQTAYDSTREWVCLQANRQHNNLIDKLNQALWNEGAFKELEALKDRLIEDAQEYLADNAMVGRFHPEAMKLNKQLYPEKFPDVFFPTFEVHPDATQLPKKDNRPWTQL